MDISNFSDLIRWPFELLGKTIIFISKYFIEIGIIIGAILIIYSLFRSGIIKRISEAIIQDEIEQKKDSKITEKEVK